MDKTTASRLRRRRGGLNPRAFASRVAAGVGVFLFAVTAVIFSGSSATRETASSGLAAVHAEAAIGANDIAFRALAQFVLLDEDQLLGVADGEVVGRAADEATRAVDELDGHIDALGAELGSSPPDVLEALEDVHGVTAEVFEAADSGAATDVLATRAEPRFEVLRDRLQDVRDQQADALFGASDLAGRMSLVSRFLVALVLPLGAIVAYRLAAMRQIRLAEVQLDAQLEAEQEIHKAKDEFIANLSHELRTPLTSIYGFSEVLIEGGGVDPETASDLIKLINGESAELGRMVEDLLVSARASAEALSYSNAEVDLRTEIESVVAPFVRNGSAVEIDVPQTPVWADPLRARQIARNLISNAIRHGAEPVEVRAKADGGRMVIEVIDAGGGVPEEMRRRLFTRFVHDGRAALTEGSVGLGLAVVKELSQAMGGDVEYRRDGDRTVFSYWLPLAGTVESAKPVEQVTLGAGADPWNP